MRLINTENQDQHFLVNKEIILIVDNQAVGMEKIKAVLNSIRNNQIVIETYQHCETHDVDYQAIYQARDQTLRGHCCPVCVKERIEHLNGSWQQQRIDVQAHFEKLESRFKNLGLDINSRFNSVTFDYTERQIELLEAVKEIAKGLNYQEAKGDLFEARANRFNESKTYSNLKREFFQKKVLITVDTINGERLKHVAEFLSECPDYKFLIAGSKGPLEKMTKSLTRAEEWNFKNGKSVDLERFEK